MSIIDVKVPASTTNAATTHSALPWTRPGSRYAHTYFLSRHALFLALSFVAGLLAFQVKVEAWQRIAMNLLRVIAGEQRPACRPAARGVVKLREAQPAPRERIEVRRGNFAAVTTEVGKAEVIGENDQEIGSGRKGSPRNREEKERARERRDPEAAPQAKQREGG